MLPVRCILAESNHLLKLDKLSEVIIFIRSLCSLLKAKNCKIYENLGEKQHSQSKPNLGGFTYFFQQI